MLTKVSTVLFVILASSFIDVSEEHLRTKRADIDLQTCIANFDIHRDKIIRTHDSTNMGAKYLTEFDLGTREECLRLCCETDNCDVFVFEEKNSGGCYLFHCGPPEDFKCKFTYHSNFSSAVLAINRHLPDLESQMKLSKPEQDLTKLRKSKVEPEIIPQVAETHSMSSTTTTTTSKPKESFSTEVKTKPSEEVRKCSRYQFECRSTSECIAIYNACDGIPQCADGSDEAPELGCPSTFTTSAPVQVHPPQSPRYDTNIPQQPLHPLVSVLPQQEIYRPQLSQETLGPPQMPPVPHQNSDFLRPLPNSRNVMNSRGFDGQIQYAPGAAPVQNSWGGRQGQMVPQMPPYPEKNSHIFNHKGSGLQVPDGQEIRYNKHKGAMQYLHRALGYSNGQMQYGDGAEYAKMGYYGNYRQPAPPENWPNPPEEYSGYQGNANKWTPDNSPHQKSNQQEVEFKAPKDEKNKGTTEQDKLATSLKNVGANKHENEPKIKIEKHKPKTEHYPEVVAYKIGETSEDGVPQSASGAVLSLTLGLIITCIMALLIACRLKVRRRIRKGGKSYAHEADYLVNGMYL